MTSDRSRRTIGAPAAAIRSILTRPLELPSWNPLFARLGGQVEPDLDRQYGLTLRAGLRGTFAYTMIDPETIGMAWEVAGLQEACRWDIRAVAPVVSIVTHTVSRSGPLASVFGGATRGLADLRLDRLAAKAELAVD